MEAFDNTQGKLDNIEVDESSVIRIDKRSLKPLNDPNCKHVFVHDPEDADNTDHYTVEKCKFCPVGRLINI